MNLNNKKIITMVRTTQVQHYLLFQQLLPRFSQSSSAAPAAWPGSGWFLGAPFPAGAAQSAAPAHPNCLNWFIKEITAVISRAPYEQQQIIPSSFPSWVSLSSPLIRSCWAVWDVRYLHGILGIKRRGTSALPSVSGFIFPQWVLKFVT